MEKQPRFFDEGDFTSAHEKIHLWAIEQFPKFNAYVKLKLISDMEDDNDKKERLSKILSEKGWLGDYSKSSFHVMPEYELEPVLNGYPPVYPDCILNIKYDQIIRDDYRKHSIQKVVIEIKSHIDSFEPVMRQMQIYRSRLPSVIFMPHTIFMPPGIFMLIYPEKYSKYDTIFKSQDIEIVHCPDSLIE